MTLTVERGILDALIARFPDLARLAAQPRLGDRAVIDPAELSPPQIEALAGLYRAAAPSLKLLSLPARGPPMVRI